ncbi:phage tail tape measure protein, partial [Haliangium sp.]|uniref:phage tail tape measure protein n=1 Tax=Haliangium sp. TaxID=2663208 RepID=UPI003D11C629
MFSFVLNHMGMGFIFTARDLASSKMRLLERNFSRLDSRTDRAAARIGASFRRVGVGLGVLAAGAVTVGGAFALADQAGTFEQGLAAVGAVTRATTGELDLLRAAAIQAGIDTQFSPDEAVSGLQSLATAGQTATQATRTLIPVLDLAAGSLGQLGVAEAAEAVVGTLNAYGMAADASAGVTDRLLRVTQLTNFQTRDFEAGLAKAAATGAVFNQALDDVLIGMGLLRNRNIDASSSATAFREAVRRVGADERAQQAITSAGVRVFDQRTGQMRSMLDIMSDFASATATMTEAERNRRVNTAFGARGLLAFNAVMNAAFTTTRNGAQVTLQGAEAIAALRTELAKAEGTAAGFREKLLDTFAGQKTLLRGTLQTLAITLGEPFAKVLKPVVRIITDALNLVIRAVQAVPAPVKQAFAAFVVAAGAAVAFIGAIIVGKAAIGLLVVGLKLLGVTVGAVVAAVLPAALAFGVLAVAVAGFVIAVRRDLGGLGSFFGRLYDQFKLFARALGQLFEQGGFSGSVRAELARAENQGLKAFAVQVFQVGYRVKRFFAGLVEGFGGAIASADAVFGGFVDALRGLGAALGFVGDEVASLASLHSDRFAASGARVGAGIARVATVMVRLLTVGIEVATGIVTGFRSMSDFLTNVFGFLGASFGELGTDIRRLLREIGLIGPETEAGGSAALAVGRAMGKVFGGIVGAVGLALAAVVRIVRGVVRLVRGLGESFGRMAADVVQLFTQPAEGLRNLLGGLAGAVLAMVDAILSVFGSGIDDVQGTVDRLGRALAAFFTETLPGWAWRGLAAVGEAFVHTGERLVKVFTETVPNALRVAARTVQAALSPVVVFVRQVFRSIMDAIDGMLAFLGRAVAKIPARFRPALLDQVVAAGDDAGA